MRPKDIGTRAETAVVNYLRPVFPTVERRTLAGASDRGDIAGIPGVVIEVKDCARADLAGWVKEALAEARHDGESIGVVWHKKRGKSSPADWYVTMDGATFTVILTELTR